MDNILPREARLQAIRDRWFSEPLKTFFPPLIADAVQQPPATCDEFVRSSRLASAFSTPHETPDAAGMTTEQALAHDRQINAKRFGVEDPQTLLQELGRQFDRALTGQLDPDALKKAFIVLDTVRTDSIELATHHAGSAPPPALTGGEQVSSQQTNGAKPTPSILQASYLADAAALSQAQTLVADLAHELGIGLPLNRGIDRNK